MTDEYSVLLTLHKPFKNHAIISDVPTANGLGEAGTREEGSQRKRSEMSLRTRRDSEIFGKRLSQCCYYLPLISKKILSFGIKSGAFVTICLISIVICLL